MKTIYYIRWKITGTCFRIERTSPLPGINPKYFFVRLTQEEKTLLHKLKGNKGLLDQFLSFVSSVIAIPNVDIYLFGMLYTVLKQNLNKFLKEEDYYLYQNFFTRIFFLSI